MQISINWWAVLVAGVVYMVVGMVWYGPLFGKLWKSLMGFTDESVKNMPLKPMTAMVWGFVPALVMAYVLAHFAFYAGVIDVQGALWYAFWVWFGFLATNTIGSYLWEGKPFKLFVLNAGAQLVSVALMSIVLVLWQ